MHKSSKISLSPELVVYHKTAKREGLLRVVDKIGASEMELFEAEDAEINALEKAKDRQLALTVAKNNKNRAIDYS